MTEKTIEIMHEGIIRGTQEAFQVARKRARDTGTPLVLYRNGRVEHVSPDDPSLPNAPECADKS